MPHSSPPPWQYRFRAGRRAAACGLGLAAGLAGCALLPAETVLTAPGGHDWPPWRTLWTGFLERGALRSGGSVAATRGSR